MTRPVAVPAAHSVALPVPADALVDLVCTLAENAMDDESAIICLLDELAVAVRLLKQGPLTDREWDRTLNARDLALTGLLAELPSVVWDMPAQHASQLGLDLLKVAYDAGHTNPPRTAADEAAVGGGRL